MMRIAFITPEFSTEYRNGGGLASYLDRICRILVEEGHHPEVFVTSDHIETFDDQGVLVHRVDPSAWKARAEAVRKLTSWLPKGAYAIHCSSRILATAMALAASFKLREREVHFDFVQSADFLAVGFFVPRRSGRPHIIRCSCAADLWSAADGTTGFNPWQCYWERKAMAKADGCYAPSRLVADHYRDKYSMDLAVVRPPLNDRPEVGELPESIQDFGERFHLHFGQLKRRKGTDFLAETLPLVWQRQPDYKMVWAGENPDGYFERLQSQWGDFRENVHYAGQLQRSAIYAALQHSEATVLPSLVDNLPNTVIESLMFDRPVVGTKQSSIDEIVSDRQNGWLVDYGDHQSLADAMIQAWTKPISADLPLAPQSPIWNSMQPHNAVAELLNFAVPNGGGAVDNSTHSSAPVAV